MMWALFFDIGDCNKQRAGHSLGLDNGSGPNAVSRENGSGNSNREKRLLSARVGDKRHPYRDQRPDKVPGCETL